MAVFLLIFKPDQFINWAGFECRKKLARNKYKIGRKQANGYSNAAVSNQIQCAN